MSEVKINDISRSEAEHLTNKSAKYVLNRYKDDAVNIPSP